VSGPAWSDDAQYTVAVDFDGVIHSYTSPWVNAKTIPDPPVPGAIEWLSKIAEHFKVVIFTTRARESGGAIAVLDYLEKHGFSAAMTVTCEKVPALIYVDDRAYRFTGGNFPSKDEIYRLKPWNKRPMGLRR
jgi:hypothetical protein